MKIRERIQDVMELKASEIRGNTHVSLNNMLLKWVDWFEARAVTESEQITLRHLLALMAEWKYSPSTRVIQIRRLKFFLRKLRREDLPRKSRHRARKKRKAHAVHRRRD